MSRGLAALLGVASLGAADPYCPAYPKPQRAAHEARLELEQATATFASQATIARSRATAASFSPSPSQSRVNFIDDHLFNKMAADGVTPAPAAAETEFLRRVTLDMTGRIPTPQEVQDFLNDQRANKRSLWIDSLIGSPAFIDYWTWWLGNRLEVGSTYYQYIGIPGRNLFYAYLRDFVTRDRSYRDLATELITAAGDSHELGPPNFILRGLQQGDPIQDTWDVLTNTITETFLGVQTQCVSCHDGRRHLEEINLYLVRRRRQDFFRQSAFLARMQVFDVPVHASQQRKGIVLDRSTGFYQGVVPTTNPGSRPARLGIYEPTYLITGGRPRSGDWRRELARMLVEDRQFARATVNYLWAHFFRVGIVEPPDGWDLARIDPASPPPAPWTLQPSNPQLLEALADEFIRTGYNLRRMIRLMTESGAYQLSSRYPGTWRPEYARYFAKHFPRRLAAEEIYDALTIATLTEEPMVVDGFDDPFFYAIQLPDPTEPRSDNAIVGFLRNFGRGDWFRIPRDSQSNVVQVLYLMNDTMINTRTFGNQVRSGNSRVARLAASPLSEADAIRELYLATMGRLPTDQERTDAARSASQSRHDWLADLQWALLNKIEFLFNF